MQGRDSRAGGPLCGGEEFHAPRLLLAHLSRVTVDDDNEGSPIYQVVPDLCPANHTRER